MDSEVWVYKMKLQILINLPCMKPDHQPVNTNINSEMGSIILTDKDHVAYENKSKIQAFLDCSQFLAGKYDEVNRTQTSPFY